MSSFSFGSWIRFWTTPAPPAATSTCTWATFLKTSSKTACSRLSTDCPPTAPVWTWIPPCGATPPSTSRWWTPSTTAKRRAPIKTLGWTGSATPTNAVGWVRDRRPTSTGSKRSLVREAPPTRPHRLTRPPTTLSTTVAACRTRPTPTSCAGTATSTTPTATRAPT